MPKTIGFYLVYMLYCGVKATTNTEFRELMKKKGLTYKSVASYLTRKEIVRDYDNMEYDWTMIRRALEAKKIDPVITNAITKMRKIK